MATGGPLLVLLVGSVIIQNLPNAASEGVRIALQRVQPTHIFEYRGYKDIQIFHYRVPEQTLVAEWNFTARESPQQQCEPRNVSVYLRPGSYPVVSPDGAIFPPDVRLQYAEEVHVQLLSDSVSVNQNIGMPEPGDWFAIAFVHQESDRIKQKGLSTQCSTWLESHLEVEWTNTTIIVIPEMQNYQEVQLFQDIEASQQITYKFYVPAATRLVLVNISKCMPFSEEGVAGKNCPLFVLGRPRAMPGVETSNTLAVNCSTSQLPGLCHAEFVPWEEEWHYVTVQAPVNNVSFALKVVFYTCDTEFPVPRYLLVNDLDRQHICSSASKDKSSKLRLLFQSSKKHARLAPPEICWDTIPLARTTFPGSFIFEYDLLPDENGTTPLKLEISTNTTTLMSFNINPIVDVGGSLNFQIGLNPTLNTSENNVSLVACLTYKGRLKPHWNGKTEPTCGEASDFSMLQVNTSGGMSSMARMIIPYPAAGTWHLTLRPFCYVVKKGNVNNTDVDLVQCRNGTSAVFFSITSSSCLLGGCGAFGRCYQYISGGFLFSTCVCNAGYRGWGCTDDAEAIPGSELLTATLLLTLSNILFVPAIAIAAYRRYFTEALVYACTMLFSALYHACDEEVFSVCLLRLNVLQFCDFYSAILAFWVTLLAMAHLPVPLTSLLHMAGAIGVALGIEYDRTGLAVFMVPTLSGIVILAVSWVVHCHQRHSCFPSKRYWLIYLPPGVILAAGGLICYAFFETEQNYKFVHSAWHATMALSIVFFLPFREAQAVKAKLTWRGLQM